MFFKVLLLLHSLTGTCYQALQKWCLRHQDLLPELTHDQHPGRDQVLTPAPAPGLGAAHSLGRGNTAMGNFLFKHIKRLVISDGSSHSCKMWVQIRTQMLLILDLKQTTFIVSRNFISTKPSIQKTETKSKLHLFFPLLFPCY